MDIKRITMFAGHYGSGKTTVAINYAIWMKQFKKNVMIADLDIVNPYFRTKDGEELLTAHGIDIISSEYASSNVDFPALPGEIYRITEDRETNFIVDVGGDEGILALGRLKKDILLENNFNLLFVINKCRPLTSTVEDTLSVIDGIALAGGIPVSGIVNNTNLGDETDENIIRSSIEYAEEICRARSLPLYMTAVQENLSDKFNSCSNIFPVKRSVYKYFK